MWLLEAACCFCYAQAESDTNLKTETGAKRKSSKSFGVTSMKESVRGHLQKKKTSAKGNYTTGSGSIDSFVYYYNNYRPAYSLQYKTPVQYRTDLGFL